MRIRNRGQRLEIGVSMSSQVGEGQRGASAYLFPLFRKVKTTGIFGTATPPYQRLQRI